jgi:Ferritin-like domain
VVIDVRDRRGLLQAAVAGTGAALLAGCGSKSLHEQLGRAPDVAASDVELLNRLIDAEHLTIAAYTAGIPLLSPSAVRPAKRFLEQETAHAAGLAALVKSAGGKGNAPAPSYDLGHPRSAAEVLRLFHRTETAQLAAYVDVIPQLQPGPVRAQAAGYLANDAQHVTVLRSMLGEPALPSPFVTGRE